MFVSLNMFAFLQSVSSFVRMYYNKIVKKFFRPPQVLEPIWPLLVVYRLFGTFYGYSSIQTNPDSDGEKGEANYKLRILSPALSFAVYFASTTIYPTIHWIYLEQVVGRKFFLDNYNALTESLVTTDKLVVLTFLIGITVSSPIINYYNYITVKKLVSVMNRFQLETTASSTDFVIRLAL